jgi:hypothetical protein
MTILGERSVIQSYLIAKGRHRRDRAVKDYLSCTEAYFIVLFLFFSFLDNLRCIFFTIYSNRGIAGALEGERGLNRCAKQG